MKTGVLSFSSYSPSFFSSIMFNSTWIYQLSDIEDWGIILFLQFPFLLLFNYVQFYLNLSVKGFMLNVITFKAINKDLSLSLSRHPRRVFPVPSSTSPLNLADRCHIRAVCIYEDCHLNNVSHSRFTSLLRG